MKNNARKHRIFEYTAIVFVGLLIMSSLSGSIIAKPNSIDEVASQPVNYPSNIDVSGSPYFPKIGHQGTLGSCAAWAMG